jgi:cell division protein FtsX
VAVLLLVLVAGCTRTVTPIPPPTTHLTVYLDDDVTTAQKSAVEAKVRTLPGADVVTFVSHQEAYRRFKELFKDRPDLVDIATPENLPESYEVLVTGTVSEAALAELRGLPGVDEVTPVQRQPTPATPSH